MSALTQQPPATLRDLGSFAGKAELIAGRIVPLMPTGHRPNVIAFRIARSLDDYARAVGRGVAYTDNMGFTVPELPSGRESFSPDAAYYDGPLPADDMDFVAGVPKLAVEVRSKSDYGPAAEVALATKRADYFQAGTPIVWDVDPRGCWIRAYFATDPDRPSLFAAGQMADAEPTLPGWRLPMTDLFA